MKIKLKEILSQIKDSEFIEHPECEKYITVSGRGKGVKELYNLLVRTYSETSDEEIYCSLSAQTIDTKDGINAGLEFFSSINDIIGEYGKKDL